MDLKGVNEFHRGEDGELRLGLRRAIRPKSGVPDSVIGKQSMYPNVLSAVVNAVSTKTMFHVFYSPRYEVFKSFKILFARMSKL